MLMFEQRTRAYIYRVLVAAGAVATTYGLIEGNELATWLGLASVVLNVLPVANTPVENKLDTKDILQDEDEYFEEA